MSYFSRNLRNFCHKSLLKGNIKIFRIILLAYFHVVCHPLPKLQYNELPFGFVLFFMHKLKNLANPEIMNSNQNQNLWNSTMCSPNFLALSSNFEYCHSFYSNKTDSIILALINGAESLWQLFVLYFGRVISVERGKLWPAFNELCPDLSLGWPAAPFASSLLSWRNFSHFLLPPATVSHSSLDQVFLL